MKRGFTLIELMIVVAIAGVLTAIVVSSFNDSRLRKEQDGIVQGLVSHLEKQKADAQAGKGGSSHGARFESTSYTLFAGTTYDAGSPSNLTVDLDSDFEIEDTITGTGNSIVFSRLNGNASENATITVSHIQDAIAPLQVSIEASGNISVVE